MTRLGDRRSGLSSCATRNRGNLNRRSCDSGYVRLVGPVRQWPLPARLVRPSCEPFGPSLHLGHDPEVAQLGRARSCPLQGCRFESGPRGPWTTKARRKAGLRVAQSSRQLSTGSQSYCLLGFHRRARGAFATSGRGDTSTVIRTQIEECMRDGVVYRWETKWDDETRSRVVIHFREVSVRVRPLGATDTGGPASRRASE